MEVLTTNHTLTDENIEIARADVMIGV